ncbi:hypothetical protein XANCAGTX0491_009285 [Xanthoria calcicola]
MGTFYIQCASILLLLFCHHLHLTSTLALPANSQTPAKTLLQLNPSHNINSSNSLSVEQNIGNLMHFLSTNPDPGLNKAQLLTIILRADGNQFPHHTLSADIAAFRKIDCIFRYRSAPRGFRMANRWPDHWDQWNAPIPEVPLTPLLPVSWRTIFSRLSVEWADVVLKQRYPGRYGGVILLQQAGRPLGWCFADLELGDDWVGSVLVETTGEMSITDGCFSLL